MFHVFRILPLIALGMLVAMPQFFFSCYLSIVIYLWYNKIKTSFLVDSPLVFWTSNIGLKWPYIWNTQIGHPRTQTQISFGVSKLVNSQGT
jgi:hypothetical protein